MKTLVEQLSQYARYHRDPRNIATHFIGIPLIVLAVVVLLSRPVLVVLGGVPVTLALLAALMAGAYYLRLDAKLGSLMALYLALNLWLATWLQGLPTFNWITWGLGLFSVGWVIQFIGHYYEGKKPAFVDDVMGLVIGPLFVMAEALFALGLLVDVKVAVEARSGPVQRRQAHAA